MNNENMNGMNNPTGQMVQQNVQTQPTSGKDNKTIYIVIAVVAVAVIAVVACLFMKKSKVLTCTMKEDMYGMEMVAEAKIKFKNDKAERADMTMTIDLGEYESQKDTFIESFESSVDEYKEQGVDYDVTSKGSKVIVKMSAEKDKFAEMDLDVDSEDYESVKKDLEESGFTCK